MRPFSLAAPLVIAAILAGRANAAPAALPDSDAAIVASLHPLEADYAVRDFRFDNGQTLPELRLHYTTLGHPRRDPNGRVMNAVIFLHGTGGSGHQFLNPNFAGVLFGPGELLDANQYFIILPDDIGHGRSMVCARNFLNTITAIWCARSIWS